MFLVSRNYCLVVMLVVVAAHAAPAPAEDQLSEAQTTAMQDVTARSDSLRQTNQSLFRWAEIGLREVKSSGLLAEQLEAAGFEVKRGISGMPTAFVASYGAGRPIIGLLAEYDALPGLSQAAAPQRIPLPDGVAGHACGHCGLGTGALGAALAIRTALEKHHLPGTIRLYGTPAEETVIGKVYMTLDGQFDDLDICLHWHPGTRNEAWTGSSKALVSAKFTFRGTPAHASVSPESGRSSLDAVELMNVGANYMREHLKEDARVHYVVVNGGGQPNVVPPTATVWYYVRADSHQDVEAVFSWLKDIADGAAKMTRTQVHVQIDTDCHEIIPNRPLAELLTRSLQRAEAPRFTDQEKLFARRLQEPLTVQFGTNFPLALDEQVHPASKIEQPSKGSTDVGDISWRVATGGMRTTCFAADSPGHSWQNVAAIGSSIGEKGTLYAARVLAVAAVELFEQPELVTEAKAAFAQRINDKKYTTLIPEGQAVPRRIR